MELIEKTKGFSKEVRVEVGKVSWPTRKELQESTMLVILSVILIMILVGIIDRAFTAIVELILG